MAWFATALLAPLAAGCSADVASTQHDVGHAVALDGYSAELMEDGCDARGRCPLRVDPRAERAGDGSSWSSPLVSVQAAIDAQAALGGGEVWVKGGAAASLNGDPAATLITLRDGVGVFGGFAGTELTRDERDGSLSTNVVGSPATDDDISEPLVVGASNATLDGFSIRAHNGAALRLRDATGFRIVNVTIDESYVYTGGQVDVADSSGSFIGLRVRDSTSVHGVPGLLLARSDVRVSDSEFARLRTVDGAAGGIAASASKVVLDGVTFAGNDSASAGKAAGLRVTEGEALVIDCVFRDNQGDRGTVVVSGARFVTVSSHWEKNLGFGPAASFTNGASASFLNASFVDNLAAVQGTLFAQNSALDVVNASFVDNAVDDGFSGTHPQDIGFEGGAAFSLHNVYTNRGQKGVLAAYTGAGNCAVDGSTPYARSEANVTQIYLRPEFRCADTGDDGAIAAATERATTFAAGLGVTLPMAGAWWRELTSVFRAGVDGTTVDPGRHYLAPGSWE